MLIIPWNNSDNLSLSVAHSLLRVMISWPGEGTPGVVWSGCRLFQMPYLPWSPLYAALLSVPSSVGVKLFVGKLLGGIWRKWLWEC